MNSSQPQNHSWSSQGGTVSSAQSQQLQGDAGVRREVARHTTEVGTERRRQVVDPPRSSTGSTFRLEDEDRRVPDPQYANKIQGGDTVRRDHTHNTGHVGNYDPRRAGGPTVASREVSPSGSRTGGDGTVYPERQRRDPNGGGSVCRSAVHHYPTTGRRDDPRSQ